MIGESAMDKKRRNSYILVLGAGFFWGILGLLFRFLEAGGVTTQEVTLLRLGFAAVIIAGFLLVKDRGAFRIRLKDLWCLFGVGLSCLAMFVCYFKALTYTTLAVAGVLLYTAPGFVVIFSAILFGEKITVRKVVALGVIFSGCICCSGVLGGSQDLTMAGFVMGIASGVTYSLYTVFSRFCTQRGYSAYTITFYAMAIGTVGALFMVDLPTLTAKMTPSLLGLGLAIGFFCCVLPYLLYTTGMRHIENSEASMLATVEPVVAALVGVIVLGEAMTVFVALGVVLVVAGILVMNLRLR